MERYSFKKLLVWQKAFDLSVYVYKITKSFPGSELYGLTSQTRRCAVSIVSNIAEGAVRGSKKEFIQFLMIGFGSGAELETQLLLAKEFKYVTASDYDDIYALLSEVMKMLNGLIIKLKTEN